MQTRVFPVVDAISKRLCLCSMGAHSDAVLGCFFVKNSYDLYTISANRQLRVWKTGVDQGGIVEALEEEEEEDDDEGGDEEEEKEEEDVKENSPKGLLVQKVGDGRGKTKMSTS